MAGLFIAFEGGEGAGKSTQEKLLGAFLEQRGYRVEHQRLRSSAIVCSVTITKDSILAVRLCYLLPLAVTTSSE